jgi:hypothetical protein
MSGCCMTPASRWAASTKLAAYLGVDVATVEGWLQGFGHPPDGVFLRCADLLQGGQA